MSSSNARRLLFVHTGKESVIYDTQLPEGIDSVQHIQDMEEAAYRSVLTTELFLSMSVFYTEDFILLCYVMIYDLSLIHI